jgi:hypothetical protein
MVFSITEGFRPFRTSTLRLLRILHIPAWVARRFQPQSPRRTQRVSRPRASRRAHRPPAAGGRAGRGRWAAQPREASCAALLVRARPSRPSRHGRRPRRRCPRSPHFTCGAMWSALCELCGLRGSFRYSIRSAAVINPELRLGCVEQVPDHRGRQATRADARGACSTQANSGDRIHRPQARSRPVAHVAGRRPSCWRDDSEGIQRGRASPGREPGGAGSTCPRGGAPSLTDQE